MRTGMPVKTVQKLVDLNPPPLARPSADHQPLCKNIGSKVGSIYWAKFAQGQIQILPTWNTLWTP